MDSHRTLKRFFTWRIIRGHDRYLGGIDHGLIDHLLRQNDFPTIDSLVAHCRKPQNLGDFLPDPRDQTLFSRRLVDGLMEFRTLDQSN